MGIKNALSNIRRIALDTNLFIYAFEQHPQYGETVKILLEKVEEGSFEAVASTITLTEILTKPIREGNDSLEKKYRLLFTHFPNLTIVSVNVSVAERAAYLRGKYGLKTPDALIVASAITSNADLFITNDQRLEQITEIRTIGIQSLDPFN
ncbi:type II toxin-antitoxin system VapC family toxin [Aneurinibacillus terranovensis]|uniref:type II toxin-antitoxin system VapC family toxin n=1 Tax=Aneurinibacillus terranovensis TaxID=278991 RepID=UPI000410A6EF|nr:type II toxin-antitoxin system VapC family toxin [Aneurinibacillus terranovensis]